MEAKVEVEVEATNRHKSVTEELRLWLVCLLIDSSLRTRVWPQVPLASVQWPSASSSSSSPSPSVKIAEKIKNNCQDTDKQQQRARDAGRCVWCDYIGAFDTLTKGPRNPAAAAAVAGH